MGQHVLGMRVGGVMGRFLAPYSDEAFEDLLTELNGELPHGFTAWHLQDGETGARMKKLGDVPIVAHLTSDVNGEVCLVDFSMLQTQPASGTVWVMKAWINGLAVATAGMSRQAAAELIMARMLCGETLSRHNDKLPTLGQVGTAAGVTVTDDAMSWLITHDKLEIPRTATGRYTLKGW